jgi:hypothetical protein
MFSAQDLLLKLRTQIQMSNVKGEADVFASQECHNLVGNEIYLGAGGMFDIRKVCLDKPLSREFGLRQQDAANPRLFSMD